MPWQPLLLSEQRTNYFVETREVRETLCWRGEERQHCITKIARVHLNWRQVLSDYETKFPISEPNCELFLYSPCHLPRQHLVKELYFSHKKYHLWFDFIPLVRLRLINVPLQWKRLRKPVRSKINVSPASECGHSLMPETGKLFENFSFCSGLIRFVAREYFINSGRPCSGKSYMIKFNVVIVVTVYSNSVTV